MKNIAMIAAIGRRGELGKNNALLWHLPPDMAHFKETTRGHTVIMGRKTWDSLPPRFRPLPGRRNIVITRQKNWQESGAESANTAQAAIDLIVENERAFVIGGAQIYQALLPYAQELILTEIDHEFTADTFFPSWTRGDFDEISRRNEISDNGWGLSFAAYRLRQI